MRSDDEKPLITVIWLIACAALVAAKAIASLDVSWCIVTLPMWGPILIGVLVYAIVGE